MAEVAFSEGSVPPSVVEFLLEFFDQEVEQIVLYGSYLRYSFNKTSDIDIAVILRDSPAWRWSGSEKSWARRKDSPDRERFFQSLKRFFEQSGVTRQYDVKVLTTLDLSLLEEFHSYVEPPRGNLATSIKAGKLVYQRKESRMDVKKGHRSFMEFLSRELGNQDLSHGYGGNDEYGVSCDYHVIGRRWVEKHQFLFFKWETKHQDRVAFIVAEPDTPIEDGASDAFRIKVLDKKWVDPLQEVARQFQAEFGMPAEVIY